MSELKSLFLGLPEAKKIDELRKLYPEFDEAAGEVEAVAWFATFCESMKKDFHRVGLQEDLCLQIGRVGISKVAVNIRTGELDKSFHVGLAYKRIPTYSSDDLFRMLPEKINGYELIHSKANSGIPYCCYNKQFVACTHEWERIEMRDVYVSNDILSFNGKCSLFEGDWCLYSLILYLCKTGHYREKVK